MKASDLFIKCLEDEDVEYIFGMPGEETSALMISLQDSKKIKFILVRHEPYSKDFKSLLGQEYFQLKDSTKKITRFKTTS